MAEKKSSNSRTKPTPRAGESSRGSVESISRNLDVQTTQEAGLEAGVSRLGGNTSADQSPAISSRNAVIEGNSSVGLDDIRKRAYELYEEDGLLDGRHEDHWYRAEEELSSRKRESSSESGREKSGGKKRA